MVRHLIYEIECYFSYIGYYFTNVKSRPISKKIKFETINEFINIWFSIYCMKELKTTTAYSMKQTLTRYVLPDLGDKKINEVTALQYNYKNFFQI